MSLFEDWISAHIKESDDDYEKYHKKSKGEIGYIPKNSFLCDGIMFEDKYKKSSPKILFISKECHAWEHNKKNDESLVNERKDYFYVREEIENEKHRFIQGLAMLCNAIINDNYTVPVKKDFSKLKGAAFINLNKRGGYKWCDNKTLDEYVHKYSDNTKQQINDINPDIIVCCGKEVKSLLDKYGLAEGRKTICVYHPSYYRVSDKKKLQLLEDEMNQK